MNKVTDPKQDHLNEVYRNIVNITDVASSLERCCQNLLTQSRVIADMNKSKTGNALYLTHAFLRDLADMELHLELLHDYYQCDYNSEKKTLINRACKSLNIDDTLV